MKKSVFLLGLIFILVLFSFVFAIPLIDFTNPTSINNTSTINTTIQINISIIESSLNTLIYNWNTTNYTLYNNTLVLMMNFHNISVLGENSTHVKDLSNYGNNGTLFNGVVLNLSGKYGAAMQFDGINDYLSIANSNSLNFGTGGFSLNFWMKAYSKTPTGITYELIGKRLNGGANYEIQISDEVLVAYIEQTGSTTQISTTYNVSKHLNEWIFVTLNRNGGTAGIYINGLLNKSSASTQNVNSTSTLQIGRDPAGANEYYNGSIDEVMIYNRGLTVDEIYQLYVSSLSKLDTENWTFYINQSKNATGTLSDGIYTYFVSASNSSGIENSTQLRTYTVDTTNPAINITFPFNNTNSSNSGLNINFTVSDLTLNNCWYSNDTFSINLTLSNCANITTVTWSQGMHNLTIFANDSVNHLNSSSVTFFIDSINPIWFNNKTNITVTSQNTVYFNITFNDSYPGDYIFSFYNGSIWTNNSVASYLSATEISITKNITIMSGEINWTWYVNDSFGNTNQTSLWTITIDKIPPNVNIISPENKTYISLPIYFNISTNENSTAFYSLDGGIINHTMTVNSSGIGFNATENTLIDNLYTVNFYVNDSFGNRNNTQNITFIVDAITESSSQSTLMQSSGGGGSSGVAGDYLFEEKTEAKNKLKIKTSLFNGKTLINIIKEDHGTEIKEFELKAKDWLTGEVYINSQETLLEKCKINYEKNYKVYKSINIEHTFDNSKVEKARIRLGVKKKWIYDNGISEIEVVKCYPYYEKLLTSYVGETTKDGFYDVFSNSGFSTWVVIGTLSKKEGDILISLPEAKIVKIIEEVKITPIRTIFSWKKFLVIIFIFIFGFFIGILYKKRAVIKEKFYFKKR